MGEAFWDGRQIIKKQKRINWHAAFQGAVGIEMCKDLSKLEITSEYLLSKEPIRIDLLVVKKSNAVQVIKNEIGQRMRRYNIWEYKGPDDSLHIDALYKTIGYACLYKGYGKSVNEIPARDIAISIFVERYPGKLFCQLEEDGKKIVKKHPGIYYIEKHLLFPVQIVVLSELSREEHSSLRILSKHVDINDVEQFMKVTKGMKKPGDRDNINAVMHACEMANMDIFRELRRDAEMGSFIREWLKDEIEEELEKTRQRGLTEGLQEGRLEGEIFLIRRMYAMGETIEKIAAFADKSEEEIRKILENPKEDPLWV